MEVTDIKGCLPLADGGLHIVRMETDQGLYGLGQHSASRREYAQGGAREHFRDVRSSFLLSLGQSGAAPYLLRAIPTSLSNSSSLMGLSIHPWIGRNSPGP